MNKRDKTQENRIVRELDRIFASLGHGMYVVDRERRILLWNRAAEAVLGWEEEDALGKDCKEFIGHLDEEERQLCETECPLMDAMDRSRTVFAGTVWAHTRDGGLVPVNVSCAPLFDDEGGLVGAVEVFSDMTAEVEIDRMKSEVCSVVAHEFRTPLTSIKGYLELIVEGDAGDINEEQRDFLRVIGSNVEKLNELIDDFLDLEKIEAGRLTLHWEELDINSLIHETLDSMAHLADKKSIKVITDTREIETALGDRSRISQVLRNLVSNAIKYTNVGEIGVRSFMEDDAVVVEVWDSGVGIPEDELERIGTKFFRASTAADASSHGSGLGLALTKEIIGKHGGELKIESTLGKGSRFSVSLRAASAGTIIAPEENVDG